MKFAIFSDTHDNISNVKKAISWLNSQKIELVLHCGDITSYQTIEEVNKNFRGDIKFVRGNGDFEFDNVQEIMDVELDGKKIFLNHYPEISRKAAESGKYDLVFYGHTHKPWMEELEKPSTNSKQICRLINPGELAGQRFKPTFAVYDTKTDKLELKILERL